MKGCERNNIARREIVREPATTFSHPNVCFCCEIEICFVNEAKSTRRALADHRNYWCHFHCFPKSFFIHLIEMISILEDGAQLKTNKHLATMQFHVVPVAVQVRR